MPPQVVAIESDVQRADRHVDALECVDAGGEPAGQRDAAGRDAQQDGARRAGRFLENLVGDAVDDPLQVGRGENGLALTGALMGVCTWICHGGPPSPPHGTGR
jgi:hypothetical protein